MNKKRAIPGKCNPTSRTSLRWPIGKNGRHRHVTRKPDKVSKGNGGQRGEPQHGQDTAGGHSLGRPPGKSFFMLIDGPFLRDLFFLINTKLGTFLRVNLTLITNCEHCFFCFAANNSATVFCFAWFRLLSHGGCLFLRVKQISLDR